MADREEDEGLVPEQFPGMNADFYARRSGPHIYIRNRVRALMLATTGDPRVGEILRTGVEVGKVKVTSTTDDDDPDDEVRERREFLVSESTVLLHHAAETLLRLYFAHSDVPDCPWLETARLRSFRVFKKRVDTLSRSLTTAETSKDVMEVFTGWGTPDEASRLMAPEAWASQRGGLVQLLRASCAVILEDANLYNASKHGFAVLSGSVGFSITAEGPGSTRDDPHAISVQGEALEFLQTGASNGAVQWQKKTTWISPDYNLAMTIRIADQIESLLSVGAARYLQDLSKMKILGISAEDVRLIQAEKYAAAGAGLSSMAMSLAYFSKP